ncbi:MAG: protein kinase domain-containing protein [Gaiellaceae bacterium]
MSETLPLGAQVAGYRISGTLGRGGMGFVYEAEHAVLGRKAALKTLLPELVQDGDFRERLVNESRTVAALDHPSIIPIYDAGDADGIVYIAMRYVAGGDLAQLVESGTLETERALDILEQVAGALDAAHANELVHRDVKPANVLVEAGGRVYLTDFGIATRARTRGLTETGFFVGTLDYAPPEQIRGEPVGAPADVYAFGCLVFECLTGKKPFARDTDVAVMYAHLRDDPPSASELRPELPASVDAVLARALAKEEGGRYPTCRELIQDLRTSLGGLAPATPPPAPTAVAEPAVMTNLPVPPTPLIGRDVELPELVELASRPDVRLVTLTGIGGTGKTRLAIAVAAELVPSLGRAFFVDLAPVAEASVVGSAIGQVLGVEEGSDVPVAEAIARGLGEGSALLVLDNFEQVMPAAELVHDLLAAAPELRVLVTSQAPLHLRDEHEYPLSPLDEERAMNLFVARAQAVKPGFELTDENRDAVAGICRRLDGLPLALELAAARVKLLSPEAILRRLEDSLDLLTGGASDLPSRQRTLRDAIDWSYQLLEPPEQVLLARLGVFAGGCSLELADAVAGEGEGVGDSLEVLASLVDKSLVRQRDGADGEPRFGLLETIREFALERLEEQGELEELRRRHAERFLALVEAAEPELLRANQVVWLERLDVEHDNIRAALAWATAAGEVELALRLAGALVRFWSTRGLMREGRARLAEALASPDGVAPAILAKAHFAAGYAALGEGDFREARTDFERSLEQARAASDERAEGSALAQLAWLSMAGGEAEEARTLAEQSSELAEKAGDTLVASGAATTLADIALAGGNADEAIELYERGLTLRRGLGDRRLVANSLVGLGRAELLRGDYVRAAALFEEALGLAREVKDTWIISVAHGNLARVRLCADGDAGQARELLAEALRLARDRNDRRLAAEWVQALAAACALEGSTAEAARFAASAEALCETTGAEPYPAEELIRERFLEPVRSDPSFAAALGAAKAQPPEELVAAAVEAAQRPSSETVTSATS